MSVGTRLMTTEEFLALPEDGKDRQLVRGELREKPMTTRGWPHCFIMSNLSRLIGNWAQAHERPRGRVYSGEVRLRLRRDPDTIVGPDLLYLNPEQTGRSLTNPTFVDEPPTLVIEILSPSDTIEDIAEKTRDYLAAGVPLVWVVSPFDLTVTVHRPDGPPMMFNAEQELTAEPHLPGLRFAVAEVFED